MRRQKTVKVSSSVNHPSNVAKARSRCTNRFAVLSFHDDTETGEDPTSTRKSKPPLPTTTMSAHRPLGTTTIATDNSHNYHVFTTEIKSDAPKHDQDQHTSTERENTEQVFFEVAKTSTITPTYQLIMGNEQIRKARLSVLNNAVDSVPSDALLHELSMSTIHAGSFFGKCFECQYMSHSQKYCPLRFCKNCAAYGHAEITCPLKTTESQ